MWLEFSSPGSHADLPYSDEVVCVSSKQCLSISRPGKRDALWGLSMRTGADHFLAQLIYDHLSFKIL